MTLAEALVRLAAADKIRLARMGGMRIMPPSVGRWFRVESSRTEPLDSRTEFDLIDPATVGCLEALACEARGETLCLDHHVDHDAGEEWFNVWCPATDREGPHAATKGEAWAADLIAVASTLETP